MDTEIREIIRILMAEAVAHGVPDYEARGLASNALQVIASHERICLERAKNADEQRRRIEEMVEKIIELQHRQVYAVIAILVAAVAFFLVPYFQHHP